MLQSGVMCRRDGETIDRLFLHCNAAHLLQYDILVSRHMDQVLPRHMEGLLKALRRNFCDKDSKLI